jgi:hypothetical protein
MKRFVVCLAQIVAMFTCAMTGAGQVLEGAGIVYGSDHAFAIVAPTGWVLDNGAGRNEGLPVVFYPDGQSWRTSETVMYANTASKSAKGQETLEELMAYDVAQFRKRAPGLSVTVLPDIKAKEITATVRRFEGDEHGNFEAVAYIDEKQTIIMLVLSARTKEGFDRSYTAFEKLVGSYQFLTSNVTIRE